MIKRLCIVATFLIISNAYNSQNTGRDYGSTGYSPFHGEFNTPHWRVADYCKPNKWFALIPDPSISRGGGDETRAVGKRWLGLIDIFEVVKIDLSAGHNSTPSQIISTGNIRPAVPGCTILTLAIIALISQTQWFNNFLNTILLSRQH